MNFWTRRLRAVVPWVLVAVLSNVAVLLVLLPAAWITPQFAKATHGHGNALLISRNDLAQILRVHSRGECCRADKVREHHGDLAALGGVLGGFVHCQRRIG